MKYFKNPVNNELHAYEQDGSQDAYILPGLVPITKEEFDKIVEANKPKPSAEVLRKMKQDAFQAEADPLFFKAQRGEATMEQWKAKVEEINKRFS